MGHRITQTWVGGEHVFALPIGGLRAVQDHLGEGPMVTFLSLTNLTARVDAPFVVLRQGLIWGGMPEGEAKALVERMCAHHSWMAFIPPAVAVMRAALTGVVDDPVGEAGGAPPTTPEPIGGPTLTES